MAKALLPDALWFLIAAHLPDHPPSPRGGRPRIGDRAALAGIVFATQLIVASPAAITTSW
jgi:transposase